MTSFNESLVKARFIRKEGTGEFLLMKLKLKQGRDEGSDGDDKTGRGNGLKLGEP